MKIRKFIKENKLVLCIIFLILGLALFLTLGMSFDPDYFWHIKAGEVMAKYGPLKRDIFSWSVSGKYWMSHEWLFEIIIYELGVLFGKASLLIYGFICFFSLLMILFLTNKKDYLKNIPFTLCWIFLSLFFTVYLQGRPHLISYIFLALTICFLNDLRGNEDSKKIYFLPVISLMWANIHGGSSNLCYLFCLIFLIGGLFSFDFSKIEAKRYSKKQVKKYILAFILCLIVQIVNIHGFKLLTYPYLNMLDSTMINNISEWQPTTLNNIGHYFYFFLLVFIAIIFLFSRKKIRFMDLLLFGVCAFLGLKSIRFWSYTYIIMSFVIFYYIGKRRYDNGGCFCILLVGCLLFVVFFTNINKSLSNVDRNCLDSEVINLVKEEEPKRLYNFYDYGGELIYNDILVFIDGRADLYSKYNFRDYLNISMLKGDYEKLIDKYNFDYFLIKDGFQIAGYLKYSDKYTMIYSKDGVYLYKKIAN